MLWLDSILCNHNSGLTLQIAHENIHDNRDDKYLYLEAMQNIRFGGQSALLKDMILGKTGDEPEFRAQAIWSAAWEGTVIIE